MKTTEEPLQGDILPHVRIRIGSDGVTRHTSVLNNEPKTVTSGGSSLPPDGDSGVQYYYPANEPIWRTWGFQASIVIATLFVFGGLFFGLIYQPMQTTNHYQTMDKARLESNQAITIARIDAHARTSVATSQAHIAAANASRTNWEMIAVCLGIGAAIVIILPLVARR